MSMALIEFNSALSSAISLALCAPAWSQLKTNSPFGQNYLKPFFYHSFSARHFSRSGKQTPNVEPSSKVIPYPSFKCLTVAFC